MSDFPLPESEPAPAPQIVPQNREAEEALLGSILINPEAYYDVAQFLDADDFYIHRHRWIWNVFKHLTETRTPIDFLTVTTELEQRGQLAEVGGTAYLTALMSNVPSALHAETYGRIIEETAIRRRMLEAANQIAKLAYDEETGLEAVMDDAEKAVFGISEKRLTRDLSPINEVLSEFYDHISDLAERPDEIRGVPTGFMDLDKLLTGLQPSDLIIIAGRPGMGKTGFALSLAKHAAQAHKKHVAIFSLEMGNDQLVQRLIAQETGIDSQRLRTGKLEDDEWELFTHAVEVLSDTRVFLDDTPGITPLQLRTKCRRLHLEYGLDLVIIDYLQLMSGDTRTDNRVQEVSYISRQLKILARELNVPVLAAAQLSRAVEQRADKRPVLSDLRESGCLAGDTLIQLPDGTRLPIRDLAASAAQVDVMALNEQTWEIEPVRIRKAWQTGVKPVYRLRTALGRNIRATGNHKFRTVDGWKRLDELQAGDHIALPRTWEQLAEAEPSLSESEAALLGHLIGDGCTLPRHAVQYTTNDLSLAEEVVSLANAVFGDRIQPRIEKQRGWYQVFLSAAEHLTHNKRNPVAAWMDDLGVWGYRSPEKRVPERLFRQPAEIIRVFLRHLWATDGTLGVFGRKRPRATVTYTTSSPQLAADVQHLLLRVGIIGRLSRVPQGDKGKDQWHVTLTGKPDVLRFAEQIGTLGAKRERLDEVRAFFDGKTNNPNRDVIPKSVWRSLVEPARYAAGMTQREFQAALGNRYNGTGLFRSNLSRQRAHRVAEILRDPQLLALSESDVYWDKVTAVDPLGDEPVYDIEVPGHHNFVANDIVVHNSLEQDADIVMFIYRPEVYDEDPAKANIAEIIIAKHRNGPVGSVQLIFRKNLAKFENAATRQVDLSQVT